MLDVCSYCQGLRRRKALADALCSADQGHCCILWGTGSSKGSGGTSGATSSGSGATSTGWAGGLYRHQRCSPRCRPTWERDGNNQARWEQWRQQLQLQGGIRVGSYMELNTLGQIKLNRDIWSHHQPSWKGLKQLHKATPVWIPRKRKARNNLH